MPLKLTRRQNTGNWYLRGTIRGREIYESTGTSDRKAADELRIKREAEVLQASIHGESLTYTFTDAALSYLEAGGEGTHLPPLLTHFKNQPLTSITQDAIESAARTLKSGCAPATWNRTIFTPVSAVLTHAARKQPPWCPLPVLTRPATANSRHRWITHEEAERLIAAARPHMQPLVIFLLSTGCRISEALNLHWKDVDLSRCHVTIWGTDEEKGRINTKSNKARGIPLHPRAVAALANLPHRSGAVFRRPKKGPRSKDPTSEAKWIGLPYSSRQGRGGGQVKTAWATMCKDAGITNFTPHDCRHTWATWHYMANRDVAKLMELGGWESLDMVMRYTHINKDHLRPSIDAVWGDNAGDPLNDQKNRGN